MIFGKKKYINF